MSETKWSPEPWRDDKNRGGLIDADGHTIAFDYEMETENRVRSAACVNACAGIPTEALESGALGKALEALAFVASPPGVTRLREARVEAQSALRSLGRLK